MKKGSLIVLILVLLSVLGLGAYTLIFLKEKEQIEPATYRTEQPRTGDIMLKTMATGTIQPRQEILIKPNISGIIRDVLVEAGDTVRTGDVLAEVTVVPNMSALSSAESRLERAKIGRLDAEQNHTRNAQLREEGVISEADFQPFVTTLANAVEEVLAAEDNLRIIRDGVTSRNQGVSNTLIRSTIGGMVLDVPIKRGNSVIEANNFNEGTTIASVADMADLIFMGKIDESEVEKLFVGMDLVLRIGAIEGSSIPAKLEYIAPKGLEENGAVQFEIKAAVKLDEGQFLRAGYSANADVVLDKRTQVPVMSELLVQYDEAGSFVEVEIGDQLFERRNVELGLSDGISVEILGGVEMEDHIKVWNQPQFE
ncbi:MAG: efflux RND transporter periplasmic adaptor subunit [Flavobacteriales bacterium]